MNSQLKLYNTLSRQTEDFTPRNEGQVDMFVCGPTVYDYSHIGHAKTYIQMDVLARTIREAGYKLTYMQNITDIDDKIIARASKQNRHWQELAQEYEAYYHRDMESLNISSVDKFAKATDYIDEIISQVKTLIDSGHAYTIEGDGIYFEIDTFKEYGKLSGRQELKADDAQSRIDHSDKKRGWNDFCLWKFSKGNEPTWPAPFGDGRPGWHIEDTAITEAHFGPQYDIHGGAVDLIFPHHEAEITQMEAASGQKPFVSYWTHTGFLTIDDEKMSKSLGNFYTIEEILNMGYDPMALRLLILQSHYRSSINFTLKSLDAAHNRLRELRAMADLRWQLVPNQPGASDIDFHDRKQSFIDSMLNDINTPQAIASLNSDTSFISKHLVTLDQEQDFIDYLQLIDRVLGLNLLRSDDITPGQKELLDKRQSAREAQDWQSADELRAQIGKQGLDVRDTPSGQIWSRL